jgi:hypothetical protein
VADWRNRQKMPPFPMQNIDGLVQSRLIVLAPTHEQSLSRSGGAGDLSIELLVARRPPFFVNPTTPLELNPRKSAMDGG